MADQPDMPDWCRVDCDLAVAMVQLCAAPDAAGRLARALGVQAPAPNRYTSGNAIALAAIGPDEWLLTGEATAVSIALGRAEAAFNTDACLALDLTSGTLALRLTGASGEAIVAALSPLDLRPARFPVGAAVRTRFGDIGVCIARVSDAPGFLLLADASYADYLAHLIRHGASAT